MPAASEWITAPKTQAAQSPPASSSVFTSYTKTYVRPANFLRRRSSDKDDTVTTKTDMSNDECPMIMQTG
jgi:hypothetical protein